MFTRSKVILRGLKAAASLFLWPTVRVLFDVPFHGREALRSHRFGKVAVRPKVLAPDKLLELGTLLAQQIARPTLELLHHLCHRLRRLHLDQHVDMIRQDLQLLDPPPVDLARLVQKMPQADGYFALQDPFPILGNPHEMVQQPVLGMSAGPVSQRHADSMPRLRFIPALKVRRFRCE